MKKFKNVVVLATNYYIFFAGDDLLEFHQAVLSTLREEEINQENFAADVQRLNELAEMSEAQEDEGPEGETGRHFLHVFNSFWLHCGEKNVQKVEYAMNVAQ